MEDLKRWWHRLRYTTCDACGREFRKGRGGGVSHSTLCSQGCWENAWRDFFRAPRKPVTWPVES